jgi:hypothetical protein
MQHFQPESFGVDSRKQLPLHDAIAFLNQGFQYFPGYARRDLSVAIG